MLQLSIILSNVGIVRAEYNEETGMNDEEIDLPSDVIEEDENSTMDTKLPDVETDEEIVKKTKDVLVIGYSEDDSALSTTTNLILPSTGMEGSVISWSSDKPEIIANNGIVTRPSFGSGSQLVTLTATISKGEVSETKLFNITVLEVVEELAPVLVAGEVERLSPTTAKVKFTSSKKGHYFYEIVGSGENPSKTMESNEGTLVSTAEETINLADLDLGAQDIYIIVKDDYENISDKLKIEIPEFKSITTSSARHVQVEDDVFLGGKYIEVGISKSGSFGTKSNAPDSFHPIERSNLGFVFDEDGFDTGKAMTSGDYFLPGGPYEGFIIGYKNEENAVTFTNAERSSLIGIPSTSIEDISTDNILAAKTSGLTLDEKLKVEQTVSFNENDKFFRMKVFITNNTDSILTDVRYMRSVDPDVDLDMSGTFETINSVPYNFPSDSKSVALAKGPVTGNALMLMSTDSRSRASLFTSDPYSSEAFNDNGVIAEMNGDAWIGLTFTIGNLAPGQTEAIEYFYSLDSDIDGTIENIENEAEPSITDEEAVTNEKENLVIGYKDGDTDSRVTKDIELPKSGANGTKISWASNNPLVITSEGKVNRPSHLNGNLEIILTATISKGDSLVTKIFKVTVIKLPITDLESVNLAKESLTIGYSPGESASSIKQKISLATVGPEETTITWSSNPAGSILEDGTVIRPSSSDKNITITATITKNGTTTTKDFHVTILKEPIVDVEPAPSSNIEKIVVDVDGKDGTNLTKTPITRTTDSNGQVKDHVSMSVEIAKEAVETAKRQGLDTARIIMPDTNDKVSEIVVEIPSLALKQLNSGEMKLEIVTENVVISIPTNSLSTFNEDLYFKVIPIKSKEEQKQVEERAKKEKVIQEVAQNQSIQLIGRPMEIETNMQSREVSIVLPLKEGLPKDSKARELMLENLVIFVEHSDGTTEIINGKVVPYKNDAELGLEFTISKFSTFSIVHMNGAKEFFEGKVCVSNTLSVTSIGCLSTKKSVPIYELVNNRLKKVEMLKEGKSVKAYENISPMLGLGGDIWVERTNAIRYETPSKSMLVKNSLEGKNRPKQIWKGLELRPGQIGKVTIMEDTVVWEKINKTKKLARILRKGEQYRVYRYVPGIYSIGDGKYLVQDEHILLQSN